jgi:TolB-like protein/DNA-binding winged helix-turn-helix (wHTH) protein
VKTSSPVPPTLRFGMFELDPRAGELRKKGIKLRLQGQPVDILAMLLERPGETVTREELQKKLWPGDTFVDFEQGLNGAMKRLRAALDDDAESPHFIETLPRHGYRFIGSVSGSGQAPVEEAKTTHKAGAFIRLALLGALVLLAVAGLLVGLNIRGWRDRLFPGPRGRQIQALAVLPLMNLSGDPEQEYFADGMTEALITELGKISAPRVISRQSIMQYKGSKKPLQEIARELNVDGVLEGAVVRSHDRVRVSVHLDRTFPEGQVWAKQYHGDLRNVMALEDEIARDVIGEMQASLAQEQRDPSSRRMLDSQAQDDYLRGRYLSNGGTAPNASESNLHFAVQYYKRAINKDPAYAQAYVGLAEAYFDLGSDWGIRGYSENEILGLAKAAVTQALDLDPGLGEAHVAHAWGLLQDWNWQEAEKEARLVVTVNPNYARGHEIYSLYLSAVGRHKEAIAQMNYALQLDPLNPRYQDDLGWTACRARQYDLAIQQFEKNGDNLGLAFVYIAKKMYPKSVGAAEKDVHQFGRDPIHISTLAMAYGFAGKKREAQKLIGELKAMAQQHYVPPIFFMHVYSGVGDTDKALMWTERAYEDHDHYLFWLKVSPSFDALRSEPRFQAVLRSMNFPP